MELYTRVLISFTCADKIDGPRDEPSLARIRQQLPRQIGRSSRSPARSPPAFRAIRIVLRTWTSITKLALPNMPGQQIIEIVRDAAGQHSQDSPVSERGSSRPLQGFASLSDVLKHEYRAMHCASPALSRKGAAEKRIIDLSSRISTVAVRSMAGITLLQQLRAAGFRCARAVQSLSSSTHGAWPPVNFADSGHLENFLSGQCSKCSNFEAPGIHCEHRERTGIDHRSARCPCSGAAFALYCACVSVTSIETPCIICGLAMRIVRRAGLMRSDPALASVPFEIRRYSSAVNQMIPSIALVERGSRLLSRSSGWIFSISSSK